MVDNTEFRSLRYFAILSVVALTVGLVGCDGERSSKEEELTPPPGTDASRRAFGSPQGTSLSPEDVNIETVGEEMRELERTAATASNWKEAHQAVRDRLDAPSSVPQHIREQAAAHAMFRWYLHADEWRARVTEEKVEVLAFYTHLLVKNRSPESDLVYAGLKKLRGRWSQQRIAEAAETTLRASERRYASIENATRSARPSSEEVDRAPRPADSSDRHVDHLMEMNRKLRAMVTESG